MTYLSPNSYQKQVHRILLIEDNAGDKKLCLLKLKSSGIDVEALVVNDFDEFKHAIQNDVYSLVLSDYNLLGWTGLDGVRWLRSSGYSIPFILVTGFLADDVAVACIQEGVNDYVLKENMDRLPFAFRRAIQEHATWQEGNLAAELLRASE